ncbi:MAG: iron-sulfur cluster assembly accessory protein [Acidiferrobacterales bacterium]
MSETASVAFSTQVAEGDIQLTPAASAKMVELLASADDQIEAIRIFVAGGGCGGMTYSMTYAADVTKYDSTLEQDGCKVVVDAVALNYLRGCEIDFSDDSFIFNNVFQAVGGSGACGGCGGGGGF